MMTNSLGPISQEPFVEPEDNYILQFNREGLEIHNQLKEYMCRGDTLEQECLLHMFLNMYESALLCF